MSKRKKHIDELFREGLKDLSLFVSDRDFDAIDGKSEVFNDGIKDADKGLFSDFELEVGDADWLATKNKLEVEKAGIERDSVFQSNFNQFEIEPQPEDWPITYKKYLNAKRRRVAFWWMSTGVILLVIGLGIYFSRDHNETVNPVSIAETQSTTNADQQASVQQEVEMNKALSDNRTINTEVKTNSQNAQTTKPSNSELKASPDPIISSGKTMLYEEKAKVSKSSKSKMVKVDPNRNEMGNLTLNSVQTIHTDLPGNKNGINGGLSVEEIVTDLTDNMGESKVQEDKSKDEVAPTTNSLPEEHTSAVIPSSSKDSSKKSPEGLNPKRLMYIGMVNQVDFTKSLLLNSNPERYNQIRKASDRWSSQYTFGFELGKIGKKIMLNAGLQATQINFSNRYNYSYKIYDSLPVYNSGGQIIGYFLSRARDTFMNSEERVKITKIQLPLNVSFISQLNKKMDLIYGFGGVLSYNVSASGSKTLSPFNTQLYRYSAFANKERTFNVMPQLNCGLKLDLSKHWMVSGQLISSIYAFSRFKTEMTVNDHPYSLGLNLKLMYKLN